MKTGLLIWINKFQATYYSQSTFWIRASYIHLNVHNFFYNLFKLENCFFQSVYNYMTHLLWPWVKCRQAKIKENLPFCVTGNRQAPSRPFHCWTLYFIQTYNLLPFLARRQRELILIGQAARICLNNAARLLTINWSQLHKIQTRDTL